MILISTVLFEGARVRKIGIGPRAVERQRFVSRPELNEGDGVVANQAPVASELPGNRNKPRISLVDKPVPRNC